MLVVIYDYESQKAHTINIKPNTTINVIKELYRIFTNCADDKNICAWTGRRDSHFKYPILYGDYTLEEYNIDYEYSHIYMANHWPSDMEYIVPLPS